MPCLETLSEINRQAMLSFPCLEPAMTPWSPLRQSRPQSKISLVTRAGLHLRDDKPFIGDPKARTAPLVLGRDRRGATDPRRITAHERQRRSCAHIFCLRPGALIAYWAVEPPSMTNSLPVTYEDSSEARYSTP
jgi:hypothetical protein